MLEKKHFDVKLMPDTADLSDPDPNYDMGRRLLSVVCLWPVLDLCLAATNKTTYTSVLKMDTKIRQFNLPPPLLRPRREPYQEEIATSHFKTTLMLICREIILLCLHR
jgi:hypothetical protein